MSVIVLLAIAMAPNNGASEVALSGILEGVALTSTGMSGSVEAGTVTTNVVDTDPRASEGEQHGCHQTIKSRLRS